MKILLTGASGYIGKRLLPVLVQNGHEVICCVRNLKRFTVPEHLKASTNIIQVNFLDKDSLKNIPKDIDGAFYLVGYMSESSDFRYLALECAHNFRTAINKTNVKHVVYLGDLLNAQSSLINLASKRIIEIELGRGKYNLTILRCGFIIGSGSYTFELLRDLIENLPVLIAPKWINNRCQPIGISDVINFLSKTILNPKTYNKDFDIGGADILTFKVMLNEFANKQSLKRPIITLPFMFPKLSSYWLYLVSSTSHKFASSIVRRMHMEDLCRNNDINKILDIMPISYGESLDNAFYKVERNEVVSSWKDAFISSDFDFNTLNDIQVPTTGCFIYSSEKSFESREDCIHKIWCIGGENGWYYGNWLWRLRGILDRLVGGVGLRRGRTSWNELNIGDTLDFWRVLYTNKKEGRLLLYAEMKLPGEAWLEFRIVENKLILTATFTPLGLMGKVYWYSVFPFHGFIFNGMIKKLTEHHTAEKQLLISFKK